MEDINLGLWAIQEQQKELSREVSALRDIVASHRQQCVKVERIVAGMERKDEIAEAVATRLRKDRTIKLTVMQQLLTIITVGCAVGGLILGINSAVG